MPRQPNMQWRQGKTHNDVKTLEKVIRNFNAKIARIEKKNPAMKEILPERLTKEKAMEQIVTRKDFNTFVEAHKSFSRRGAEKVVNVGNFQTTKWMYNLHEKAKQEVNKSRAKRKEEMLAKPALNKGEELGYTMGEVYSGRVGMHSIDEVKLEPITRRPENMSQKEFRKSFEGLERQMYESNKRNKDYAYKKGYLEAMIREGFSQEQIDFVKLVPDDILVDRAMRDYEASIDFVYDELDKADKWETIKQVWGRALHSENLSQSEWASIIKDNEASDVTISIYMNYVSFGDVDTESDKTWEKIFKKAGMSEERIKSLLGR